jgi:biotin carboxylase
LLEYQPVDWIWLQSQCNGRWNPRRVGSRESGRNTADGLLVLVGGGARPYREYLLESWARRGMWLLDQAPADWQRRYLAGHTEVPEIRSARLTSNVDALVRHVERLAAERTVDGLLTYDEMLVASTARLAERFNRPGLSVGGAENCRDKGRTRRILTDAGLPQPGFGFAAEPTDALRIAERVGFPVVVKPRGLGGSIGVVRAEDPRSVLRAFAVADEASRVGHIAHSGGALVEELLDGPEVSIDGAVQNGEYRPIFVARKTVGLEPFFEETGHIVDPADSLQTDAGLLAMLRAAHRALNLRDGLTHTEVKLTRRGPIIVEVNGRLGGDLIPYLGRLATGVDAADIAADIATGVAAHWQAEPGVTAGIRFCYPSVDGIVRGVRLPRPDSTPGLVCAQQVVPDGTVLRLPPRGYMSRYAFVVCEASDPIRCAAALRDAAAAVSVDLCPA